jgi:hypothetical protein
MSVRLSTGCFAATDASRLQQTGVRGAATPRQLAQFVQVDGWIPIDASIDVGDVAALVGSLGGANLSRVRSPRPPRRKLTEAQR